MRSKRGQEPYLKIDKWGGEGEKRSFKAGCIVCDRRVDRNWIAHELRGEPGFHDHSGRYIRTRVPALQIPARCNRTPVPRLRTTAREKREASEAQTELPGDSRPQAAG